MKRVSEINEIIKFNNTKIGGMKEIMVKAHALARLTREPKETYAKAFRRALKSVWRLIRRSDRMQKRVYIYMINGRYALAETRMNISVASDYFCMIESVDKRWDSAVRDVENDDFCYGIMRPKEELRLLLKDYIESYLPQLMAVENYNKNVGSSEYTIEDDLRAFINNGRYKAFCTTMKDVLLRFINEYCHSTICRIKNYVSSYGLDEKR